MSTLSRFSQRSLGVLAAASILTLGASARQTLGCATGGPGGAVPASGTGGTGAIYPTTLPASPFVSTLNVASLPPGSTVVTEVRLNGLTHTWAGDVQWVLTDPSGAQHNLFNLVGGSCDYGGNYVIVPECTGGITFTTCAGVVTPGTYDQVFGDWPSGTNGIANTPLSTIPAATGNWTLTGYDWFGGDIGTLTSWDVCFGTPPTPTAPTAIPTLFSPANGAVVASPVTLTWNTSACATSYDVDVDGVVTTGIVGTSFVASAGIGSHTWAVRGANASGVSNWSAPNSFNVPGASSFTCVTGGAGGSIPMSGAVDGTWPTVLPTGELVSTLSVTVPSGGVIAGVRLNGLNHTWSGDCHIVLTTPSGQNVNIFQQMDGVFGGGCADDFAGNYTFVDNVIGLDEFGFPALDYVCGTTPQTPGTYKQYYGAWTSGDAGIDNAPLQSVVATSGTYTLKIYDWYIAADDGTLASWDLCLGGPAGPTTFCTPLPAGTTNGCVPTIAGSGQPDVTHTSPVTITASGVEGQKLGLIFYGVSGQVNVPWCTGGSSFLCVKAPTQRMPSMNTGGIAGTCSGSLVQDWNAFQNANPFSLGNPFISGATVDLQGWFRDPPACKTTSLTEGLRLTYQ